MINPKVIKVKPEQNYMLNLWFANTVTTFLGSVTWANNSDLSYDTLYLESVSAKLSMVM